MNYQENTTETKITTRKAAKAPAGQYYVVDHKGKRHTEKPSTDDRFSIFIDGTFVLSVSGALKDDKAVANAIAVILNQNRTIKFDPTV